MDQFQTVFMGGYRKDEVDERLKALVAQIETLYQEAQEAAKREERLKAELAEAHRCMEEREAALNEELSRAHSRIKELEEESKRGLGSAARRYSESPDAESTLTQGEKDARAEVRLLELERDTLNRRIMSLEDERERREAEHRRETAGLRENLDQQRRSAEAAERILQMAEQEARALVEEAQVRTQEMERRAEEDIRAKRQAALQTLEGARVQVMRYVDTFNITQRKLAQTYRELDTLAGQFPRALADSLIIDLEEQQDYKSWGDTSGERQRL